ncbi:MAG: DNA polymerase IV [Eggerthellaceae bacterium]|nr:DNA polymerase IV [Eggerthellaceae bacterium]
MDRVILHSDMNSFYASVEQAEQPDLRGKPVVVAGKEELRHGIVLTKSIEAKRYGIKTAEALWEARAKCPNLIVLPPRYKLYRRYSEMARAIYYQYTDLVEPFGLDECWLDITGSLHLHGGDALVVAREISERVKAELGCTVSIGVSWNKIFAKFGSDYKKPDAITPITRDNYRDIVWTAPVRELLYVGPATERKLHARAIRTIGELAAAPDSYLQRRFGKIGFVLRTFARGEDTTPVKPYDPTARDVDRIVKSYGNGLTAPHSITCAGDAKALIWILSESVAQRMREDGVRARTISIGVRNDTDLSGYGCQVKLPKPSAATRHVAQAAWAMLVAHEPLDEAHPIRALHVRASDLVEPAPFEQLSLLESPEPAWEQLDCCIDDLRRRFGNTCIVRGVELLDDSLRSLDIKDENTVHPVGYFHR